MWMVLTGVATVTKEEQDLAGSQLCPNVLFIWVYCTYCVLDLPVPQVTIFIFITILCCPLNLKYNPVVIENKLEGDRALQDFSLLHQSQRQMDLAYLNSKCYYFEMEPIFQIDKIVFSFNPSSVFHFTLCQDNLF